MYLLTEGQEEELRQVPEYLWSQGPADVGLIKGVVPIQVVPKSNFRPYQKQYPMKPEAIKGIMPTFEQLRQGGVIVPGDEAFCKTPVFPVKKAAPSTDWRMVTDLQGVNNSIIPQTPCVPDPHTLLNQFKPENAYFTVIDLANSFFSILVHPDSQGWFGFTFLGKKWVYSRLPMGFSESPTIFSQALT